MSEAKRCQIWDDMDLFSKDIDIYYKGKGQRTSLLGRIFTLLYVAIYIAFFLYKIIRMIKKLDVTFYQIDAFNGNIPSIQTSNEIFYTTLALISPKTGLPYYDDTIYEMEVVYHSQVKKGMYLIDETTPEIMQIESCKVSNFGSHYHELFENKQVELSQCVPKYDKLLRGHRTYDYYSYYEINFYPCVNTSDNNFKCQNYSTLYSFLTSFGINFKMQDIELTPQNYENPVQYRVKELTLPASSNLLLNVYAYVQIVNIETDEDVLGFEGLGEVKKEKYLKYAESQILASLNQVDYAANKRTPLAKITITLSENELTQTRSYPKLLTVLGDVGGLMEIIFSFFKTISVFITEGLYRKSLVNHLLSFDLNKQTILIKNLKTKKFKKTETIKIYNPDKLLKKSIISIDSKRNSKTNEKSDLNMNNIKSQSTSITKKKPLDQKLNFNKVITKKEISNLFNSSKPISKNSSDASSKLKNVSKIQNEQKENEKDLEFYYDSKSKENSKRIFFENNAGILKENLNNNLDTEKEKEKEYYENNENIINKINFNKFGICASYFFYCKRRQYVENILLEEGMRLIIEKLDIQNIFKKLYKDDSSEEKNIKLIEMSDICKSYLRHINFIRKQTLVL